jgi:hypothetical protein
MINKGYGFKISPQEPTKIWKYDFESLSLQSLQ